MPVRYSLRENGGFVHVKAMGRFTSGEINDFLAGLAADASVKEEHVILFDATGADSEAIDDVKFGDVAKAKRENPDKVIAKKMAILVKDRRFLRNAASFQEAWIAIGVPTQVFTRLFEATNWLSS